MNDDQVRMALLVVGIFAAGAVSLILYQHSLHSGQIIAAVQQSGATSAANSVVTGAGSPGPIAGVASLAGTVSPGQENATPIQVTSQPLQVDPGWLLH